jgi:carbon-monoxide dehydrogenase medium subunit
VKPPRFDYVAPDTLDEVLDQLARRGDDAKVLAGGQSLLPLLSLRLARPSAVIDLSRVQAGAGITEADGTTVIGGLTRQRDAERSTVVAARAPLLAEAIPLIGHTAIRNRGTVGGSLAHADPAAELPAATLAAAATMVARSTRGERTIPAAEFFLSYLTTALEADELLTEIRVPVTPAGTGTAFVEFSRRHGDFAIVGVAAVLTVTEGRITQARVALSGVDSTPVLATTAAAALTGNAPSEALWDDAAAAVSAAITPPDDLHGSSSYRRHLAGVLTRQALRLAAQRAEGSQ